MTQEQPTTTTTISIPMQNHPRTYLLLENDKKSNNLGPILRCAAAYNIHQVLAIGYAQCSVQGSHGASKHVQVVAFPTVKQAIASIHPDRKMVRVVGILLGAAADTINTNDDDDDDDGQREKSVSSAVREVREEMDAAIFRLGAAATNTTNHHQQVLSFPVGSRPFSSTDSTTNKNNSFIVHCFVINSKNKLGLVSSLARNCDSFVHIPQQQQQSIILGTINSSPLLDIPSSLSIVLHHYSEWRGLDERTYDGEVHKFELVHHQNNKKDEMEVRMERKNQRQEETKQKREEMDSKDSYWMTISLFDAADEIDGNSGDY